MSMTTTYTGVRIVDMPDLGAITDAGSVVGEHAGSGRFQALALRNYCLQPLPFVIITTYGAVPNSGMDCSTALAQAFAALAPGGGGTVMFPPGTYNFASPFSVPNYMTLCGNGPDASAVNFTCAGNPNLTLNTSSHIRSMMITASVPQTGTMIFMSGGASSVDDFTLSNYFGGISMAGPSSSVPITGARVSRGSMYQPVANTAGFGIRVDNFAGCFIYGIMMTGAAGGIQPGSSLNINNGDTLLVSDCNMTCHGALNCSVAAGLNTFALAIVDCLFDSAHGQTGAAIFNPLGGVQNTTITGTWFGYSGGHGLVLIPNTGGVITGMEVTGCQFVSNSAGSGVRITGSGNGVFGINVTGSRAEGNSQNGAHIDGATLAGITFNGFRAGAGRPANGGAGIVTAGALDHYVITNCSLYGNTGAALTDGASGTHKVVANNLLT